MDIEKINNYLNESARVAKKQLEMVDEFLKIAELVKNKMEKGGTLFFLWKWWISRRLPASCGRICRKV
jgi:hypothetical protein